ncbi:MAG: hypothetical protein ACFFA0_14500 [Promethearchaeota archaeon]
MNENSKHNSNCDYCGWKFLPELLRKIEVNNDPIPCENCGKEISIESSKIYGLTYNVVQEEKKLIAALKNHKFCPHSQYSLLDD